MQPEYNAQIQTSTHAYTYHKLSAETETNVPEGQSRSLTMASLRRTKTPIRFMATGNQPYRVHHLSGKDMVARCEAGRRLPASTPWFSPGATLHESLFLFQYRSNACELPEKLDAACANCKKGCSCG